MANNSDNVNIPINQQLNQLLADRTRILESQTSELRTQLDIMNDIVEAAEDAAEAGSGAASAAEGIAEAMGDASDSASSFESSSTSAFKSVTSGAGKATKSFNIFGKLWSVFKGTLKVVGGLFSWTFKIFVGAFKLAKEALTDIVSMLGTAVSVIWDMAKAILSLPVRIFNAVVDWAQGIQGSTEFMQAIEDVRKQFGSFRQELSHAVMKEFRNLRGNLKDTGLSAWRAFGNMAERLNFVRERATELGATFEVLSGQFKNDNGELMYLYKGLGLTAEGQKGLAMQSIALGIPLKKLELHLNNLAQKMVKGGFAASAKTLSRAVQTMTADVRNFGTLSTKAMIEAAVYVHKLGLEIKDVTGLVDAWDNFEDAAKNASQLGQAFGLNVDAFDMMNTQSEAERLDKLRNAMKLAGKSADTMSRQELHLLASHTGLTDEVARQGLSMKNLGMSYSQVKKAADKAEKQPLSQAEAMTKLAEAIERVVKSGSMQGNLFDIFFRGFFKGIEWSREFRGLMYDIHRVTRIVYWEGRRLGLLFVQYFPGVKQLANSFRELFKPAKWRMLFDGIRPLWIEFFKHPEQGAGKLLDGLKDFFGKIFGPKVLSDIKDAFVMVGRGISMAIAGILRYMIEGFAGAIRGLTRFIRTPGSFSDRIKAAFGDAMEAGKSDMWKIFEPIVNVFRDPKLMGELGAAFKDLWASITESETFKYLKTKFGEIKDWLVSIFKDGQGFVSGFVKKLKDVGDVLGAIGAAAKAVWKAFTSFEGISDTFYNILTLGGLTRFNDEMDQFEQNVANRGARIAQIVAQSLSSAYDKTTEALQISLQKAYENSKKYNSSVLRETADAQTKQMQLVSSKRREMADLLMKFQEEEDAGKRAVYELQYLSSKMQYENELAQAIKYNHALVVHKNKAMATMLAATKTQNTKIEQSFMSMGQRINAYASNMKGTINTITFDENEGTTVKSKGRGKQGKVKESPLAAQLKAKQQESAGIDMSQLYEAQSTIDLAKGVIKDLPKLSNAVKMIESQAFKSGQNVFKTQAGLIVTKMVDEVNMISAELDKLTAGSISVVPKLAALGKVITGKDSITINNKHFSINIDMKVQLDAVELARQLAELKFKKKTNSEQRTNFVTIDS